MQIYFNSICRAVFGLLLLFETGCQQIVVIADEVPDSDSATQSDSNVTSDSASSQDTGVDSTTGSSGARDTETLDDTATADSATVDTSFDTADTSQTSDVDSGLDTNFDTATESETGTVYDTDTATVASCTDMYDDTEILSEGHASDFDPFGEAIYAYTSVTAESFSNAWQFETASISDTTTGTQLQHMMTADIAAGDHLVVEFWTLCNRSDSGQCRIGAIVEKADHPWTNLGQYFARVGADWEFHQVPMRATEDFPASETHVTYRLGYENQEILVYPVRVANYGPLDNQDRLDCLPNTTEILTDLAIVSDPDTTAFVDIVYDYFIEVNGWQSTIKAPGLPSWLKLSEDGRHLNGTPTYADVGTHANITVQAENVNGTVSQTFGIAVSVDPALVGHWPLDESEGAVATDVSGNGRDGIVNGDPVWQPTDGRMGGSLRCDGYTGQIDYVMLPSDAVMDTVQNGPHTITAWVRAESIPAGVVDSDHNYGYGILIKPGYHVGLWYGSDEKFHSDFFYATNEYRLISDQTHGPGTFYHVAARMDPDKNDYALFVGGRPVANASLSGNQTLRDFGTLQWRIGVADPNSPAYGWYGDISVDDVRIYRKALTDHEIRSLAEYGWFVN